MPTAPSLHLLLPNSHHSNPITNPSSRNPIPKTAVRVTLRSKLTFTNNLSTEASATFLTEQSSRRSGDKGKISEDHFNGARPIRASPLRAENRRPLSVDEVIRLQEVFFLPGEVILEQGNAVGQLYFVYHGLLTAGRVFSSR